jgi:hypothetical protein
MNRIPPGITNERQTPPSRALVPADAFMGSGTCGHVPCTCVTAGSSTHCLIAKPGIFELNHNTKPLLHFKPMSKALQLRCCWMMTIALFVAIMPMRVYAQQEAQSPMLPAVFEFVQRILSAAGNPGTMSVSFQDISILPTDLQEVVQNAIFTSFRNSGVQVVSPERAVAQTEITFSESWREYVWVARVQQGTTSKLVIKKVPRPEHAPASRTPMMTVRKNFIWRQDGPMLDFAQDDRTLAVLEPTQIAIYSNENGNWRPRYTLSITHAGAWPRDLRGRILINGSQVTAFLPGTRCNGSTSPPSLDCHASDDPWQVDQGTLSAFFSPRRNFFTGILAGQNAGGSVLPFFSAATWQAGDTRQWLFTGTDGRTRLYQYDLSSPAALFNIWGSNIAAVHSGCGSGWQLLVSAPTDSVRPDSIQAMEIAGREALPVSSPVELSGAVQALWTSGKNSELAHGIMQSPATGRYEAFTLTVSCGQ